MAKAGDKYIGELEFQKKDGDFDVWTVIKRGRMYLIGTPTNTGLLSDYYYKMEAGESEQNALQEINDDLEAMAQGYGPSAMARIKRIPRKISPNPRRGLRRNEEYARQIPRRDRPMRGRGFDKRFDVSAGSDYKDLYKIVTEGKYRGARKIGDNTFLNLLPDQTILVRFYGTPILTYRPNGEVDVNFGGYMTNTTFSRINNLVPYGWNLRKKAGKLALENSWGQRAVIRKPRAGEEYSVRLTSDKAYLID
jgi:hypothetical protein